MGYSTNGGAPLAELASFIEMHLIRGVGNSIRDRNIQDLLGKRVEISLGSSVSHSMPLYGLSLSKHDGVVCHLACNEHILRLGVTTR